MILKKRDYEIVKQELLKYGKYEISRYLNNENCNDIKDMARNEGIEIFQKGKIIYNLKFFPNIK